MQLQTVIIKCQKSTGNVNLYLEERTYSEGGANIERPCWHMKLN